MERDYLKKGISFFDTNASKLREKGFVLEIGEPTQGRDNNSLDLYLKSKKVEISIIIWELGSLYFGGVDWEKDNAWNDNFTFENEDEMLNKMEDIIEQLL